MDEERMAKRPVVLVVEDDEAIRELLRLLLSEQGYDSTLAENKAQVTASVTRCTPTVVMLDMHVPDGPEAIVAEVTARVGWMPVLAMSTANDTQRSEMLGAYAFLSKPFDLDEVVRVVARRVLLADERFPGGGRPAVGRPWQAGTAP